MQSVANMNRDTIQIFSTEDGSHSLFHTALQETYHSKHGALQESRHVFIDAGLSYFTTKNPGKPIRVLEVGFGTGLNALLSLLHSKNQKCELYFESWEKDPVPAEIVSQLNYGELLKDSTGFLAIHNAPWNKGETIHASFTLHKIHGDITSDALTSSFDIIFYDAFAPDKQPDIWTFDVIRKVTGTLSPGGVLVTYCAKGQVKRDLASLGLIVETLPGPPGKNEMTRALKPM